MSLRDVRWPLPSLQGPLPSLKGRKHGPCFGGAVQWCHNGFIRILKSALEPGDHRIYNGTDTRTHTQKTLPRVSCLFGILPSIPDQIKEARFRES